MKKDTYTIVITYTGKSPVSIVESLAKTVAQIAISDNIDIKTLNSNETCKMIVDSIKKEKDDDLADNAAIYIGTLFFPQLTEKNTNEFTIKLTNKVLESILYNGDNTVIKAIKALRDKAPSANLCKKYKLTPEVLNAIEMVANIYVR